MSEIQTDAEFQAELLSLRETVGEIFETIFETEVLEMNQFTKEDIGVPDEYEIWHDTGRAVGYPRFSVPAPDDSGRQVLMSDHHALSGMKWVDNPSDIR